MTNLQLATMTISQLDELNLDELRELARASGITGYTRLKKYDLERSIKYQQYHHEALSLGVAFSKLSKMALAFCAVTIFCQGQKMSM